MRTLATKNLVDEKFGDEKFGDEKFGPPQAIPFGRRKIWSTKNLGTPVSSKKCSSKIAFSS